MRRYEDIDIDWDNLDVRIILIAPSFRTTVPRMAGKIGYAIDLVQIRRYCFEEEEFLVVETVEEEPQRRVSTTKVLTDWDWDYYESEHGKEATAQFHKAVDSLAAFVERQGWDTPYNLNKYYTGFKLGNKVVFSVGWSGTYAWHLSMKLPADDVDEDFKGQKWEFQRYDRTFRQALFRPLQPDSPDVKELEPFLVKAYKHISGAK